ncbi:DUF6383 domain-containing protein [uncultured Parabacteroides sp.]|uniref:DUF6383 domain-containing protein n=1 Tax=uncultured Parabacteroides sp. TaxID=512312 RepID=UPI002659D2E6|nr:DUF6383 domain-containing protein [uncultured Parabacteroides sp.]
MNKKFSTLMALALVAGSVSAQNWKDQTNATVQGAYRTFETKSAPSNHTDNDAIAATTAAGEYTLATAGAWTKNVYSIDRNLYYQLEVKNDDTAYPDVLVQERDYETGEIYLRTVKKDKAPLNASLWRIEYSKPDGVSGGYFTYLNKETGLALTFDHSVIKNDSVSELRAGIAEWSWYTVNASNNAVLGFQKVYSYLHNQSDNQVMYLSYEVAGDKSKYGTATALNDRLEYPGNKGYAYPDGNRSEWKLVKAKVANTADAGHDLNNLTDVLEMKPVIAAPFFMTAEQFNTRMDADNKLNADTFLFKMNKDLQGAGVFLNQYFTAEENALRLTDNLLNGSENVYTLDANGIAFTKSTEGSLNPLANKFNLNFKTAAGTYLLADTARYQDDTHKPSVSPAVMFGLKTPKTNDNTFMKARYYFRATYFPTNDSIVIEPLNAAVQADFEYDADMAWSESAATTSFARTADYSKANTLVNDYTSYTSKTVSLTAATIPGVEKEVITVAKDGKGEFKVKTTIDRPFEYLNRATKESGLYFINLANHNDRQRAKGMWIVKNMAGNMMYDTEAMNQRYDLMPSAMWTVEQLGCEKMGEADSAKYVKIQNREYPGVVFEGQLYSKDGVNYRFINREGGYSEGYIASSGMFGGSDLLRVADSLTFTKVTDPVAYTREHGYKMFTKDELNNGIENNYQIKWNNFMNDNLYLQSNKDTMSYIDEASAPTYYEIAEATLPTNQGAIYNEFGSVIEFINQTGDLDTSLVQLHRKAYVIKVKDNNLIDNNRLYIASVKAADGRYYYRAVKQSELNNVDKKLAVFYLKANQVRLDDNSAIMDTCYVLVDINKPTTTPVAYDGTLSTSTYDLDVENGWMQAAVEAGYKMGNVRDNDLNDEPNDVADAFYTTHEVRPQYVNISADYDVQLNSNIKIYQQLAAKNYLFEDCKDHNNVQKIQDINKDFHYLGLESRTMDVEKDAALYVDEVVKDYALMQRYLFGVRVDSIPDGFVCDDPTMVHGYWDSQENAEDDGETHYKPYNGYTSGWFLVNLEDSIGSSTNMMDNADLYKFNNYTRLGFVEGIHQVDGDEEYLYIVNPGYTLNDLMTVKDNGSHAKYTKAGFVLDPNKLAVDATTNKGVYVKRHSIKGDVNTNHTFSLRKTNTYADGTYDQTASEPFLLESACKDVADFEGMWVKSENGIPVLAKVETANGQHENGTGAAIAEKIGQSGVFYFETTTDEATANDEVSVSSVTVISGNGSVQVAGAAGKKVVITNILGQTVANTVLTSDNATIAAPAGVVVVAVEGEEAVKAIVK